MTNLDKLSNSTLRAIINDLVHPDNRISADHAKKMSREELLLRARAALVA